MVRIRFSMAGLMGLIGLLAVGLAALKSANKIWSGVSTALILGALLFALLSACYSADRTRRFWCGFALFGWAYLVFTYGPWFRTNVRTELYTDELLDWLHSRMAHEQGPPTDSESITVWVKTNGSYWVDGQEAEDDSSLTALWAKAVSTKPIPSYVRFFFDRSTDDRFSQPEIQRLLGLFGQTGSNRWHSSFLPLRPERAYFCQVGHCLLALLAALQGGLLVCVRSFPNRSADPS